MEDYESLTDEKLGKTPKQIKTLAYHSKKKLKKLLVQKGVIEMKKIR